MTNHNHFLILLLLLYVCFTYTTCHATPPGTNNNDVEIVQCAVKERDALLQFKHGILVDKCGLLASWRGNLDCCQWRGVRCNNHTGHVIMLHLPGYLNLNYNERCLEGTINDSLVVLKHLKYLDLSSNNFNMQSIPKFFGSLAKLEHLNLSNAIVDGDIPHEIGNLSRLSSLDLSCLEDNCYFTKLTSLSWLSQLRLLRHIDLGGIDLSLIPNWISTINGLPLLEVLRMHSCGLSAELSTPLSYINSSNTLHVVDLSWNDFNATTAVLWLSNLNRIETSLVYLDLSYNRFSDGIPSFIWKMNSVSHLDLSGFFLEGDIPSNIGNMKNLSFLNLGYNYFSGQIPSEIWTLTNLTYLSLNFNQLEGFIPITISNLQHLEVLDLYDNPLQIKQEALESIGKLCKLQTLCLQGTNLTYEFSQILESLSSCAHKSLVDLILGLTQVWGSVPKSISKFSSLRTLDIGYAQLNGTIDDGIGQLSKLEELDLRTNNLSGVVSHNHFSNLSNLKYLELTDNINLVINLSVNWIPPFQLSDLQLRSCKVGPEFPKWLRTQQNLTSLDISSAGIFDVVPKSFWSTVSSTIRLLNMSNNGIHGVLPDLLTTFQLVGIDLSSNKFSGAIPSFRADRVTEIDLNDNKFSQGLSYFLCPETEMALLNILDLSNNLFFETLPDCWSYFPALQVLRLQNNSISGKLPSSIAAMNYLEALHVSNNNLSGELPASWVNFNFLVIIDLADNSLSGHLPPTFARGLVNLNVLSLRNNKIYGGIPSSLCQLSCLQILDLSGNHLSGPLPRCVHKLNAMTNSTYFTKSCYKYLRNVLFGDISWFMWKRKERSLFDSEGLFEGIDISNNRLQGLIPVEITSLIVLVFLNLSQNNLSGPIPSKIGQLTSLQFLDLSNNHLSGEIPRGLASISFLEILDLSKNNLSGRIPLGTQLQGFDTASYNNNPGLCGDPLPKCPRDQATTPPHNGDNSAKHKEHKSEDIFLGLLVSVVLGFITGFWGVCGTLVLKRSWRQTVFRFYDNIKDRVYVNM